MLQLLHMDLMGLMQVECLAGKRYAFVCIDDFSKYAWVDFIKEKLDIFHVFRKLCKKVKNEQNYNIVRIRGNHGREFENSSFEEYCNSYGISHKFSSPITP